MKDFAKSIVCNAKAEASAIESASVGNYDPNDYKDDPRHKWTVKSIENEIQKYKQRIELNRVRMTQLRNMENSGNYPSSSRELKEEQKDYEANQMKIKQLVSMLRRATGNSMEEVENAKVGNADLLSGNHIILDDDGDVWFRDEHENVNIRNIDSWAQKKIAEYQRSIDEIKKGVQEAKQAAKKYGLL